MGILAQRIENMAASQTVAMNQRSKDMQAEGVDVINLSVGEPDFPTPSHIKKAAKKAINNNHTFYSPVPGYPELRKAITNKLKEENGLDYSPEQVIVSNGAKHSIANAIMTLIDPGAEVIVPAPYWVSYIEQVKLAGGNNIVIKGTFENDFKITSLQLEKAITPKTKALILCSPSNPSGAIYNKQELKEIAEVIEKHKNIFVITDEVYEYINFTGNHESIAQFDRIKDRVAVVNGVSKGFAMTGWRIGYLCGPEWLVKACTKLQGQFTTGPSSISQMAAVEALNASKKNSVKMVEAFNRRKKLVLSLLDKIEGIRYKAPQGAFYVFPDVSSYFGKSYNNNKINNSTDIAFYLLEEAHVATVMGDAFGIPECIRISFSTSDKLLEKALKAIHKALDKLK